MSGHMRTTIRLSDALLDRARREARRRGTTVTALIEEGLQTVLRAPRTRAPSAAFKLPVCSAGGGTLPGVDLNDSADLLDRMEGSR